MKKKKTLADFAFFKITELVMIFFVKLDFSTNRIQNYSNNIKCNNEGYMRKDNRLNLLK